MENHQSVPVFATVKDADGDGDGGSEAPWLTLVHGVSQDRRLFSAQVVAYRSRYRLLLIDLPGHGESSHLPGPYGIEEFALGIGAALQQAEVGQSHFWSTHIGGGFPLWGPR